VEAAAAAAAATDSDDDVDDDDGVEEMLMPFETTPWVLLVEVDVWYGA